MRTATTNRDTATSDQRGRVVAREGTTMTNATPPVILTMGEVMTPAPHTIGSDQTLAQAHKVMRESSIRHLPVLRAGKLVGVLTQRDLYFLETISGVDIEIDRVADAMTPDVYAVSPDEALRDVAEMMALRKYGCAVVLENNRVLGIFTVTDALHHLAQALA